MMSNAATMDIYSIDGYLVHNLSKSQSRSLIEDLRPSTIPGLKPPNGLHMYANAEGSLMLYYVDGNLHRDKDEPAVITPYEKRWYQNGILHREGHPACIYIKTQEMEILLDGDNSIVVLPYHMVWYNMGKVSRTDGPAIVTNQTADDAVGTLDVWSEAYLVDGVLNKNPNEGPAVRNYYMELYVQDGVLHREDGPAAVYDGMPEVYSIHGEKVTKDEFESRKGDNINS